MASSTRYRYAIAAVFAAGALAAPAPQFPPQFIPSNPQSQDQGQLASTISTSSVSTPTSIPTPGASPSSSVSSNSSSEPSEFTANPSVGGGGDTYTDSARFRIYGATGTDAENALQMLESAYTCFVTDLGWRSSGLSYDSNSDTAEIWYKENVYSVASLDGNAAGVMGSDYTTGYSYVQVVNTFLADPSVTVHEYGHALTYHVRNWVDQTMTGAWWEPLANWFADTWMTSDLCASAREQYNQEAGSSVIELQKVIGDSYQVIVDGSTDTGNYYQSWPLFTYMTNNPDNFTGLGTDSVLQLNKQYDVGSNETPLHTLQRLVGATPIAKVIGRYWAHMAYVDISDAANEVFLQQRESLTYDNLELSSDGTYTAAFTATLAIRSTNSGSVRYVDLENGKGEVIVGESEEASLVVVNTPEELIQYNPFELSSENTAQPDDYDDHPVHDEQHGRRLAELILLLPLLEDPGNKPRRRLMVLYPLLAEGLPEQFLLLLNPFGNNQNNQQHVVDDAQISQGPSESDQSCGLGNRKREVLLQLVECEEAQYPAAKQTCYEHSGLCRPGEKTRTVA
ncbi:hypothetical protein AN3259.2 [Aspergillus nidulans FGSC A4]|uniref:Uncharacterized protein n=1 Tax=Emericella nidulans (strain FGSC A4 / ATCC 38163 / CBS 112.46 / NRRL 194 / M139) TaxID=227321 RepID=Q5B871_EMENI|nr:hypothetical protein [Aspergillus nidulans FGSC A4]EAA63160.1 hypothetical protein AN3259.2 [Aspergillus nidulans FGSC A4]CBF83081.1 TPA: conserved hypothetical protein [Aspergillus nidulans FGSC A4]|eukprot:XP_660863.1 hypothetical protein AN3259.2 [Aspergillus nidulans FGSC A4]